MKNTTILVLAILLHLGAQAQTALHLDAVDDYVEIDTIMDGIYDFAGDFTIEAWVKAESGGMWPSVVSKFDNVGGSRFGFWFGINGSGTVGMQIFDGTAGTWPNVAGTTFIQDNNWYHIAGVMHSDTMKVYVNGILEGSLLTTFTPVFNEHAMWIGNDAENDIYHGTIDEVRIWNDRRTEIELIDNKDVELCPNDSSLVAYFQFNEGIANVDNTGMTDLANLSFYTNNGTLNNFTLMGTTSNWVDGYNLGAPVTGIDSTVSPSGITLTSNQTGATYQWLDCDNGFSPVNGETGQSFTASSNGNYAVEVTMGNCSEISQCHEINSVSLNENTMNLIRLFPNPATSTLNIDLGDLSSATIDVYNTLGQLILRSNANEKIHQLTLGQESGLYFVTITSKGLQKRLPLIIE
jgi:hypothetical protein